MGPLIALIIVLVFGTGAVFLTFWWLSKREDKIDETAFKNIVTMDSAREDLEREIARAFKNIKSRKTRSALMETLGPVKVAEYLRKAV